jgi:RimJ/RimL family protein N-acetyltransferase
VSSVDNSTDPLFYAIIDLATNKSVGIAAYLRIDTHNRTVEVGWLTFSEQLRRSTAATEAMYLMATHAFELGYRRYEWKCNALNAPSIAAAERLGFSFEGVFRNAVIVKGIGIRRGLGSLTAIGRQSNWRTRPGWTRRTSTNQETRSRVFVI